MKGYNQKQINTRSGSNASASPKVRLPPIRKRNKREKSEDLEEAMPVEPETEEKTPELEPKRAKKQKVTPTTIVAAQDVVWLERLDYASVLNTEKFLRAANANDQSAISVDMFINQHHQYCIQEKFKHAKIKDWEDWKSQPYLDWLIPNLKQVYPRNGTSRATKTPFEKADALKGVFPHLSVCEERSMENCVLKLRDIASVQSTKYLSESETKALLTKIYKMMGESKAGKINQFALLMKERITQSDPAPTTLDEMTSAFCQEYLDMRDIVMRAMQILNIRDFAQLTATLNTSNSVDKNRGANKPQQNHRVDKSRGDTGDTPALCNGCGRAHAGACKLRQHPDYNNEPVPWLQSTKRKAWAAKPSNHTQLPWRATLDDAGWNYPSSSTEHKGASGNPSNKGNHNINKREYTIEYTHEYINSIANSLTSHTVPVNLQATANYPSIVAQALIDTGALHGNYINHETAKLLDRNGAVVKQVSSTVCSALGNCEEVLGQYEVSVTINKTLKDVTQPIHYKFKMLCSKINSPYDIIIGRPCILESKLLPLLYPQTCASIASCSECTLLTQGNIRATQSDLPVTQLAALYMQRQLESR